MTRRLQCLVATLLLGIGCSGGDSGGPGASSAGGASGSFATFSAGGTSGATPGGAAGSVGGNASDGAVGSQDDAATYGETSDAATHPLPASDAGAPSRDTSVDGNPATCDGFSAKPLVPPSTCDKSGGLTSSEKPPNGLFSTSWFGCYLKQDGTIFKDASDNCLFACGSMGLCAAGKTGPQCEADLKWFSADADRYGCGAHIRVTNCKNGKQVVLAALDRGPNCTMEKKDGAAVLDMSYPAMTYLFDGKTYGGTDLQRVNVEMVSASAPLGPI